MYICTKLLFAKHLISQQNSRKKYSERCTLEHGCIPLATHTLYRCAERRKIISSQTVAHPTTGANYAIEARVASISKVVSHSAKEMINRSPSDQQVLM